ncbi:MAG: hypothetical protein QM681_16835 [Novosphingobium sp.]
MNQQDMTDEDRAALTADIQRAAAQRVNGVGDDRTANNAVRHTYRVLSDAEKAQMVAIKDKGAEFLTLIDSLRTVPQKADPGEAGRAMFAIVQTFDRELNIAAEKVEEAVMWAVKHITA